MSLLLPQARHAKGFSLVETLLIMSLVGIILAASIPAYQKIQTENDLTIAFSTLTQALRLAQLKAQAVEQDSGWGIHGEPGIITIFKGASFATREQTLDETYQINKKINIAAPTDFFFLPFSGRPQTPGAWQISNSSQTRSISVNQLGTLIY